MTPTDYLEFITFLENRGLLSEPMSKFDYERTIWEYMQKSINSENINIRNTWLQFYKDGFSAAVQSLCEANKVIQQKTFQST